MLTSLGKLQSAGRDRSHRRMCLPVHSLGSWTKVPLHLSPTSPSISAVLLPVMSQKEVFVGFYYLGILKKMMATLEMLL